ncbi:MAG TPA: hypothetical protein VFP47_07210, partial [Pyrinomonadaceae bacterium]|nr:hypothetical protein [Pyrinomonadaceae bacterium]
MSTVSDDGARLPARTPIDREELPLQRSLISQTLSRLKSQGKLKAIAPLAGHEGCVNTIANLIGEIERSAKSPSEVERIISARNLDLSSPSDVSRPRLHQQIDFDREIALIYSTYSELLQRHQLTEQDADQVRALAILNGELDGQSVTIPWLAKVELLVLDGFFDFTPVQGEILRRLIPKVPDVVVNLNHDELNQDIFLPFQETIDHLRAIDSFEIKRSPERLQTTQGALANLRKDLFNPSLASPALDNVETVQQPAAEITYFECGDRDTEIRAIAKEIKRLVLREAYSLSDIALVVRQRASYAETITRVMRAESVPCNLEMRIQANDIPANRAALKLFAILEDLALDETATPKTADIADLIKSEYFRLNDEQLRVLSNRFNDEY